MCGRGMPLQYRGMPPRLITVSQRAVIPSCLQPVYLGGLQSYRLPMYLSCASYRNVDLFVSCKNIL